MRHSSKEMFDIPEPYVTVAFEHIFEKNYRKQVMTNMIVEPLKKSL